MIFIRSIGLLALIAILAGCLSEIPSAASLPCPEMNPKRNAERAARIARFERERQDVDLQYARSRASGSIRHLNHLDQLRDALSKDLKALDDRYIAACAAGGPAPSPTGEPTSSPTVAPSPSSP